MTPEAKIAIGVGVAIGGLIWALSGKKKTSTTTPPQEQLPACPTGFHREGLVCVADTVTPPPPPPPPPLSESAIADRERDAITSTNQTKISQLAGEVRGAGRPTVGLDAWAMEAGSMAGTPVEVFYRQAIKSFDSITLTRSAAYVAAEGFPQAGANFLAMAALRAAGPKGTESVKDAAEKGAAALYGGVTGVASFAIAAEELRVMISLDPDVYITTAGVKAFLLQLKPKFVQDTKGLDGRVAELAAVPLTSGVANGITAAIALQDKQKLLDAAASLAVSHKQLSAQLSLLASLVGSDIGARVGEIRTVSEAGV